MVHKICKMKDKLCDYAYQQMERGLDQVDTHEMGMVVDMIKDLAEAEKSCLEADYYESVVEAMEEGGGRYGYDDQGGRSGSQGGRSGGRSGYHSRMMEEEDDGEGGRMGYRNQYGNWPANPSNRRRRMRRRGYTEESVENLRQMMEEADPARREQLKKDLEELMREM